MSEEKQQHDIYRMAVEQGCNWPKCGCQVPSRDCNGLTGPAKNKAFEQSTCDKRPLANGFDWELQQALIHLRNAMSMTDSRRSHLLISASTIVKGVKES
ncbi:hypothetical protein AAY72_01610 [Alishewanella sp. WH16-1]|uniref:hypothetical protein n=1 Tax=Alishewanella sp. WH16-1 TaxID=1651088 RepID=UPI00070E2A99|nr:hypothetical protein [Alishewanella sp. WH16-1]KRS22836.1 hypothetical protein AAY72_01610 [Alishewanella sp. WH16-1]